MKIWRRKLSWRSAQRDNGNGVKMTAEMAINISSAKSKWHLGQ
jgi:hypothetical protein